MKLFSLVSLFFILSSNAFAECKEIKICWEPYDPFQVKKGDKYTGLDFDIAEAVAQKMNCKIKYEEVPWKRCLAGIEAGQYDGAGSASKNAEREKFAHFTNSYISTANAFFTTKETAANYKLTKMADLLNQKNFKLAVVRGYDYGSEYQELLKNPAFKAILDEADSEEQSFKKIAAGRAQGTFSNEYVGVSTLKSISLNDKIVLSGFKLPSDDSFFMFSKKSRDDKFISDFNAALEEIKKDGSYQKILDAYVK